MYAFLFQVRIINACLQNFSVFVPKVSHQDQLMYIFRHIVPLKKWKKASLFIFAKPFKLVLAERNISEFNPNHGTPLQPGFIEFHGFIIFAWSANNVEMNWFHNGGHKKFVSSMEYKGLYLFRDTWISFFKQRKP